MEKVELSLTSQHKLIIDETNTCFIQDEYREVMHIYLPDLIRELINVNNMINPNIEDHFIL